MNLLEMCDLREKTLLGTLSAHIIQFGVGLKVPTGCEGWLLVLYGIFEAGSTKFSLGPVLTLVMARLETCLKEKVFECGRTRFGQAHHNDRKRILGRIGPSKPVGIGENGILVDGR